VIASASEDSSAANGTCKMVIRMNENAALAAARIAIPET